MGRRSKPKGNLKRNYKPLILPRRQIFVFSEGEKTEPDYLREFVRMHCHASVRVKIIGTGSASVKLVEIAKKEKRKQSSQKNSFAEADEYWVAFDRDDHARVSEAIEMAQHVSIKVAFSNPCFEVWLILHCDDTIIDAPQDRHELQKLLGKKVSSYDANSGKVANFEEIAIGYEAAQEKAVIMQTRRIEENDPWGNPFTNFNKLTEAIRDPKK